MKGTKRLAIILATVGGIAVFAAGAMLIPALQTDQPAVGIIGGADFSTFLLLVREVLSSAVGWLLVSGMLCLVASAVTAIIGTVANKR